MKNAGKTEGGIRYVSIGQFGCGAVNKETTLRLILRRGTQNPCTETVPRDILKSRMKYSRVN